MTASFSSKLTASQLSVASAVASLQPNDRLVVAGRAGSGKSYAVASGVASRIAGSSDVSRRILVVAGARVLAEQWAWTFREMDSEALVVDPSEFRDLQLHTPTDNNPWDTPRASLVATYIDFVKSPERLQQMLESQWDAVVLDDLPVSQPESLRHRALMDMWESHRPFARILVTWTGDSEMVANAGDATVLEVDVQGPDWKPTEIRVDHTTADAETLEAIYAAVSSLPGFVGETMFRRAGSSLFALEQSLSALTVRVQQGLPAPEAPDDTPSELLEHPIDVTEIAPILELIQNLETDGKWETLRSLVERIALPGTVIVFTDFADTAEYLTYLFESEDIPAAVITGRMRAQERAAAIKNAHSDRYVLVVSNPGWTQQLAVAGIVNYDLPADPKRLDERYGSIGKLGSEAGSFLIVDPVLEKVRKGGRATNP